MSDSTYTACGDVGEKGFGCEAPKNHSGSHYALDGEVTWENE